MDYETKQLLAMIAIPAFAVIVIGIQIIVHRIKRRVKNPGEQVGAAEAGHEPGAHPA